MESMSVACRSWRTTVNPQLIEVASWKLLSELQRRFPRELTIIETHPGGGLYDCLSVYDSRARHIADLNRKGRLHVFEASGRCQAATRPIDIWTEMIDETDPKDVLDRVCSLLGLAKPKRLPPSSPATLVYRFISTFLTHSVFGRDHWECRNGMCDTSGYGGGVVSWFDRFPQTGERLRTSLPDDLADRPAYRFWFVLQNGKPTMCLETTGHAWCGQGAPFDLVTMYKRQRRIWPLVAKIAGHLLP